MSTTPRCWRGRSWRKLARSALQLEEEQQEQHLTLEQLELLVLVLTQGEVVEVQQMGLLLW